MFTERINKESIESSFSRSFITAILGPRRVGKTLFVLHYAQKRPQCTWVFLNMDEMVQRERVKKQELEEMIAERAKQQVGSKNKIWVMIDEVQKCPEAFDQVKILYDKYKGQDKVKFILTGSAVLSLHQLSAETLAGRIELYHLQEFTLREATLCQEPLVPRSSLFDLIDGIDHPERIGDVVKELKPFKPQLQKQLEDHLLWGGFPEVLNCATDAEKIVYLNNYIQTYLEKDVRAIETIENVSLYRNMMAIIAEQTGSIRDEKKLIDALGCTRDTLKKYRGYLTQTLLYQDVYPFISSPLKRLVKSPKGYLLNNGLISCFTGITKFPLLIMSTLVGHRFENWFLNELNAWLAREPMRSQVCFWRLTTGVEVDFVVERKPKVYPFEVTYSDTIDSGKVRNLTKFLIEEPAASWAYYVYRGEFQIDRERKICFIPAWAVG
jgi:predicted AAA+ superfamily ATPase